jgi:hypothetical protein
MPNTYTELARQTLGTNVDDVTFSSISGSYTDLVLVIVAAEATANTNGLRIRVGNNTIDTGNNYSNTYLTGTGTSATSNRESNNSSIGAAWQTAPSGNVGENVTIFHLMNYSNTTTFKTVLGRSNQAAQAVEATVGLWRSTSAINTVLIRTSAGSGNQLKAGSTFSLYGIANADLGAAKATGGIITEDANYWYHTFAASGTFTPKVALSCDYLVVAGGGGGGSYRSGGGGAGGFKTGSAFSVTATNYSITVGAGGTAGSTSTPYQGGDGTQSVFSTITSAGGGGGGGAATAGKNGRAGGSGGGGSGNDLAGTGGAGNSGEGNNGGTGGYLVSGEGGGGGGGGASAVGATGSSSTPGAGGAGTASSYSGLSVTYATGGIGGHGVTSSAPPVGTINTGNGGGGGNTGSNPNGIGAAGGSGIVIIRYAK